MADITEGEILAMNREPPSKENQRKLAAELWRYHKFTHTVAGLIAEHTFKLPLVGGSSVVLTVPTKMSNEDVTRVESWIDLLRPALVDGIWSGLREPTEFPGNMPTNS